MKKIIFILLFVVVSCKTKNSEISESKLVKLVQFRAAVDSIFNGSIDANEPGAAVLIAYDGKMLVGKGYGIRDLESNTKVTKSTNFELASLSKQFTALAVLSLIDKGKLSLNDTIYQFFPYETFKNVTVQQIINHTSGIEDAEKTFLTDWNSTKIAKNSDILKWYSIKNRKINNAGQVFQYNDGAYEILPLLVEKISGKEFEDYIKVNVFKKSGMVRTNVYNLNDPFVIDERAFYYHKDTLGKWNKMDGNPLTGLLGAGGVYTNIEDYFHYDNALRNNSIFSYNSHGLIFKPSTTADTRQKDMSYGMGWFVNDSIAQHSGGWDGVNTFARRYLKQPLTIVFFANTDDFFKKDLISKINLLSLKFVKDNCH